MNPLSCLGGTERQTFSALQKNSGNDSVGRREQRDHCELRWCGELPQASIAAHPDFSWHL